MRNAAREACMSTAAGKKIAIVTGSALGLGYELARQLIAKGWFVAGIDFNTAHVRRSCHSTFGCRRIPRLRRRHQRRGVREGLRRRHHGDRPHRPAHQQRRDSRRSKTRPHYEAADVDKCLKGLKGMVSVERRNAEGRRRAGPQNRQRHVYRRHARQPQRIRLLRHQVG